MLDYVREGIEIAKAQSKYTVRDFMRRMDLSANTFYRRVREYEITHGIAEQTIV
jgi:transcriptional regulator of acetoin/glycerol metabolism